jgi:hypothetical protein
LSAPVAVERHHGAGSGQVDAFGLMMKIDPVIQ